MSKERYFSLIKNYVEKEFSTHKLPEFLPSLEEPLAVLILCNNTKRVWPSTEGLEFGLVRELLYNFKLRTMEEFLKNKQFAFLYQHYFNKRGKADADSQKEVPVDSYYHEMLQVYEMAQTATK